MKKEIENEWRQILDENKEKFDEVYDEAGGGEKGFRKISETEPAKTFLRIKSIEDKLENNKLSLILVVIFIIITIIIVF